MSMGLFCSCFGMKTCAGKPRQAIRYVGGVLPLTCVRSSKMVVMVGGFFVVRTLGFGKLY